MPPTASSDCHLPNPNQDRRHALESESLASTSLTDALPQRHIVTFCRYTGSAHCSRCRFISEKRLAGVSEHLLLVGEGKFHDCVLCTPDLLGRYGAHHGGF